MSDFLRLHWLYIPWNSLGQNTGLGSSSLLQGIFPTLGSNPCLPHCRQILYQLSHQGIRRITRVVSLSLLQQLFLTQELNWGLLYCKQILYQLRYQGSNNEGIFGVKYLKLIRRCHSTLCLKLWTAAAAAKSLQLCPTLCHPRDSSLPGSPIPGILQARSLEWVAISFSNAWKWKVKVKLLSRVQLLVTHGLQPTRLHHPWDFPGKSTRVGYHCLLWKLWTSMFKS